MSALNSPTANLKLGLTLLPGRVQKGGAWVQTGVKLSRRNSPSGKHWKNISEATAGTYVNYPLILWVTRGWSIISSRNSVFCTVKWLYIHHPACCTFLGLCICFHSGCWFYVRLPCYFVKQLPLLFYTTQTIFSQNIIEVQGENKLR